MNPLHLIWIVPLAASAGIFGLMLAQAAKSDKD